MQPMRIIVSGFIGLLPAGGVTWDYIQYPLGFSLLGHDVYYIEDTRLYPVYQKPGSNWNDSSSCINHLQKVMHHFGFSDRWAYRDEASGKTYGMAENKIRNICRTADVFVNISCAAVMRDEYYAIPTRILVDSDPMFTQIQYVTQQQFTPGEAQLKTLIESHTHHFSFGENINAPDCLIPKCGIEWQTTRQPVCLNSWTPSSPATKNFTTLMNWTAGKVLHFDNQTWGQKDIEFKKIISLPKQLPSLGFSVVMNRTGNTSDFNNKTITDCGWNILDSEVTAGNWCDYQRFIYQSYAEFSVAKETYVKAKTGWFSCRSACYLAVGKPVVTQDTGWSKFLPSGCGLLPFTDLPSAIEAIKEICGDYKKHSKVAREIAVAYFDSSRVLSKLLSAASQTISLEAKQNPAQQP